MPCQIFLSFKEQRLQHLRAVRIDACSFGEIAPGPSQVLPNAAERSQLCCLPMLEHLHGDERPHLPSWLASTVSKCKLRVTFGALASPRGRQLRCGHAVCEPFLLLPLHTHIRRQGMAGLSKEKVFSKVIPGICRCEARPPPSKRPLTTRHRPRPFGGSLPHSDSL